MTVAAARPSSRLSIARPPGGRRHQPACRRPASRRWLGGHQGAAGIHQQLHIQLPRHQLRVVVRAGTAGRRPRRPQAHRVVAAAAQPVAGRGFERRRSRSGGSHQAAKSLRRNRWALACTWPRSWCCWSAFREFWPGSRQGALYKAAIVLAGRDGRSASWWPGVLWRLSPATLASRRTAARMW